MDLPFHAQLINLLAALLLFLAAYEAFVAKFGHVRAVFRWVAGAMKAIREVFALRGRMAEVEKRQNAFPRRPMALQFGVMWAKITVASPERPDVTREACCPICAQGGLDVPLVLLTNREERETFGLQCPKAGATPCGFYRSIRTSEYHWAVRSMPIPDA